MTALLVLTLVLGSAVANAWQPPPGVTEVPVWPEQAPALRAELRELEDKRPLPDGVVTNVRQPTYTVFAPKSNPSGTAIVVFPGGGYKTLYMNLEGVDICTQLTSIGVTCILLKYRVPYSGCHWDDRSKKHITPPAHLALQDAQRTLSTIRHRAQEYQIDPHRIGVMGFSAGGNLAILSSSAFKTRSYVRIDAIDDVDSRPDFAIPVYPGHITMEHKNISPKKVAANTLNTDIQVSAEIPPTLLLHAQDDRVDPAYYSTLYEEALRKAGVNVQLKLYATGGHAFGVRPQGTESDRWPDDVQAWLRSIQMLEAANE
jgi:acetyl esterase/lipase